MHGHEEKGKEKPHQEIPKAQSAFEKMEEEYKKQVTQLKLMAEEYKDTLQRVQAEFENAGKRLEREKDEFRKLVGAKAVEDFLPVVDSVEEGIKQAQKSGNEEMKKGFENMKRQLLQALERNGVKPIETSGKKFDHSLHEVLMTGKDESKSDDAILEEFKKGYTVNGKILRPAKVKVNKRE